MADQTMNHKQTSPFYISALDLCPSVVVLAYFEDEIRHAELWSATTLKVVIAVAAASLALPLGRIAYRTMKVALFNFKWRQ